MPVTKKMNPLQLYVPISRIQRVDDGGALFVEGYAYVNAIVGDRWNLKRSAMEAATADYMQWGAVREMHQPSAAGTATGTATVEGEEIPLGVTWDERGAFLRTIIVDPAAIEKCERGVYKGFSVGVQPTVTRGNDVEKCDWYENSLVDRPADKDASFTSFAIARSESAPAPDAEIEVEDYEPDELLPEEAAAKDAAERASAEAAEALRLRRGVFADKMKARENSEKRGLAMSTLSDALCKILGDASIADPEGTAREAIAEFADYIAPLIAEARAQAEENAEALQEAYDVLYGDLYYGEGIEAKPVSEDILTRFADATREGLDARREVTRLQGEHTATLTRIGALETELTTVRGTVVERDAEIQRLRNLPDPRQQKPVLHAVDRQFAANLSPQRTEVAAAAEEKRTELERLTDSLRNEPDPEKRNAGVIRLNVLRQELAALN